MSKAIIMNSGDNVATLLNEIKTNEEVNIVSTKTEVVKKLKAKQDIHMGHKISIIDIKKGEPVRKFGEPFGLAIKEIETGEHVHVHNVISNIGKAK